MRRPLRHILLHLALMVPVAALGGIAQVSAQTATWVKYATVSPTTTLTAGSLCYSDGRDIACDGNAASSGGLAVDRITSGTAGVFVSNTGVINFRTGGTTTGYFDTAGLLVVPGVSVTSVHGISSTNGYFNGNVGVGTTQPSATLHVSGSLTIGAPPATNLKTSGTINLYADPSAVDSDPLLTWHRSSGNILGYFYGSGGNGKLRLQHEAGVDTVDVGVFSASPRVTLTRSASSGKSADIGFVTGSATAWGVGYLTNWPDYLTITQSATPLMIFSTSQTVGIKINSPTVSLEVSGTVSATTLATSGTLKVSGTAYATAFVGDGSGLTNLNLSGSVNDRITSGTAGVFVSNSGVINFSTGGVTTGYFDTSGLLVAPGVSLTSANGISSTNGYFNGTLTVSGSITTVGASSEIRINGLYPRMGYWGGNTAYPSLSYSSDGSGLRYNNSSSRFELLAQAGIVASISSQSWSISPTLLAKGISVTDYGISSTSGYFSGNVGVGTGVPSSSLHIVGAVSSSAGGITLGAGSTPKYAYIYPAGNGSLNIETATTTGGFNFKHGGATTLQIVGSGGGPTTFRSYSMGVGGLTNPSATLHVSGSIIVSDDLATCDANRLGGVKYQSGSFYVCQNASNDWEPLVTGGVSATLDRITSNSQAGVVANSSGYISFTTGGVTGTTYIDTAGRFTLPGISVTTAHGISSTNGYFSGNVGIGYSTPGYGLQVRGGLGLGGSGASGWLHLYAPNNVVWSMAPNANGSLFSLNSNANSDNFFSIGNTTGYKASVGINISTSTFPSATLHVSGTARITSWTAIAANVTATAALDVYGTVSATAFVGNGSGLTGLSAGDRITSGTAGVYVSDTGVINFRTGGVTTGYFDTAGTLLAPGVSVTGVNGISSTIGYFSSNLSVRGRADVGTPSTYNVLVGPATGLANTGSYNVNVGYISGGGGSVSYVTSIGTYSAQSNSASYLVAVGTSAGQYNTGNYATLINGGQFNKGSYVTSIGIGSASSNSGTYLSALGMSAGARNAGNSVVAVGYNAAGDNTGSNVTAVGVSAAASNTFNNVTALGYRATSDKANQVILGNSSVVEVTTTGVILAAGVSTTGTISATRFVGDGSGLTGLGTGDRITSGTAGVFVSNTGAINFRTGGVTTGYFDTAGLLVGPGISLTSGHGISSTNGYFSGNVGIGTNAPSATLHVQGGAGGGDVVRFARPDTGAVYGIGLGNGAFNIYNETPYGAARSLKFSLYDAGIILGSLPNAAGSVPSATIHVSGSALITSWTAINFSGAWVTPTAPLEVSGTVSATGVYVHGDISYTGVLTDTSDRRLKTKIAMMDGHMLEKLMLMQPVTFEMKDRPGLTEYGFIAQDVKQIFPDLVFTANDASKTMSMSYVGLIAPMIQGMQELRQENQSLKAKTDALEGRLERLERLLLESKAAVKH